MKRRELMAIVSLAAGLAVVVPNATAHPPQEKSFVAEKSGPMGFIRSGNPKAAGGPLNPGKGNPWTPY